MCNPSFQDPICIYYVYVWHTERPKGRVKELIFCNKKIFTLSRRLTWMIGGCCPTERDFTPQKGLYQLLNGFTNVIYKLLFIASIASILAVHKWQACLHPGKCVNIKYSVTKSSVAWTRTNKIFVTKNVHCLYSNVMQHCMPVHGVLIVKQWPVSIRAYTK